MMSYRMRLLLMRVEKLTDHPDLSAEAHGLLNARRFYLENGKEDLITPAEQTALYAASTHGTTTAMRALKKILAHHHPRALLRSIFNWRNDHIFIQARKVRVAAL